MLMRSPRKVLIIISYIILLIYYISYVHTKSRENNLKFSDLDIAAKSLANLARRKAKDKSFLSPFSLAAKSAGFDYTGGKVDDITVIVSCVSDLGTEV